MTAAPAVNKGPKRRESDRRRFQRLDAVEMGVVMFNGRLHPLLDWSPGGFLCAVPMDSDPEPGMVMDVRLIVTADGMTVADFDVTAELVRLNPEEGTVAAKIETIHGIAAARFQSFFSECQAQQVQEP